MTSKQTDQPRIHCALKKKKQQKKTRNLTNTFRVQNRLANRITLYISYILKAVLTVNAPKVFGSRQSYWSLLESSDSDFTDFFL